MSYFGKKLCPALVSQQEQTKVDEMSQQQHKLLSKSAQKLDFTTSTNAAKLAGLYIEKMSFSSSTMLLCYNSITTSWSILGSNHVFKMWGFFYPHEVS